MIATRTSFKTKAIQFFRLGILALLAAERCQTATASVSASLSWPSATESYVTGYNIYYGGTSHTYTNFISVGQVTNLVIQGLAEGTVYYFAVKAHDIVGDESDFSSEIAFEGCKTAPNAMLRENALPTGLGNDPLSFSLAQTGASGASIGTTNGILSWTPGITYASSTNYFNVQATDTVNPAKTVNETMAVSVLNYYAFQIGSLATLAGQANSIPLTLQTSGSVTNLQIVLNWPETILPNPTLTNIPSGASVSFQDRSGQLVINLQASANQPLTGTNHMTDVSFQTLASGTTALANIAGMAVSGQAIDGTTFTNVPMRPGQVAVVGTEPLLQSTSDATLGRSISVYANSGSYQLQSTTSLMSPVNWSTLATFQQSNLLQVVRLDTAEPVVFYRIQKL